MATIDELLEEANQRYSGDLLWACLCPNFLWGRQPPWTTLLRGFAANLLSPRAPTNVVMAGRVVSMWHDSNSERAIKPIVNLLHPKEQEVVSYGPRGAAAILRHWAGDQDIVRLGIAILKAAGQGHLSNRWRYRCVRARRMLMWCEALFRSRRPAVLLVANQAEAHMRAAILTARKLGIASVLVPHAPVARLPWSPDLPCDYVGLRGTGEADYYRALGCAPDRLTVIGNPASDVVGYSVPESRTGLGVLAMPAESSTVLEQIIGLIAAGTSQPLLVSPHPRSNLDELRAILPRHWILSHQDRTLDLIKQGPPFLIQCSSGVAWESLVCGVPTANIVLDKPSFYPFFDDRRLVRHLSNAADVREFVETPGDGSEERARRKSYALHWCGQDGQPAGRAGAELVERAVAEGAKDMILDGWAPGGAVWSSLGL